jgi:hypothetical protein
MMSSSLRTRSPKGTRTNMHLVAGIPQCSTATTPTSSTKGIGMQPMLITTMNTEPPAEAAEEHQDDDYACREG